MLAATSALASTQSPADWRDIVIYQVVTDRFADGNPANNAVEGNYAPADGAKIHGGDFAGIEGKLDYLVNLGVSAIWISPVVLNANAEYHGYAARNFYAIAPHFGTLAELQSMVAACHARGIYVIMDVVVNHMGDLIRGSGTGYPAFKYPGTYTLSWRSSSKRYFGVLDDLSKFHAHGNIGNFVDPEQILGELFGLDDLKTEDPVVQNELTLAAEWLIDNTDCDGFRIDTVKHVEMGFWSTWAPAVHGYAQAHGKAKFFLFGEVFDGDDAKCGSYTGTQGGGNYKLDSVLHYPMYFTATGVFALGSPTSDLSGRYSQLAHYDPTSREQLVTFLDNHDNSRFLSFGSANQDESLARTGLVWLLTSRGVPCVYYGTEQEFDGGGDPYDREDMWDGQWDFGPSNGDNYDLTHPLFLHTRRVLDLRQRHEALRRGAMQELTVTGAACLYAYDRTTVGDTVLVAINTSNAPLTQNSQTTRWPAGTILVDAMNPTLRDTLAAPGVFTLRMPARGVRIYESLTAHDAAGAGEKLHVVRTFPGHDQNLNDRWTQLVVAFDRDPDPATLPGAFHMTPAKSGAWRVEQNVATFFPSSAWSLATAYEWSFDTTLKSADGRAQPASFASRFQFSAGAIGIMVPAGFVADSIAGQGLTAPEGLLSAPALGGLLVTDTQRDRIFTLTPGGDLGHWLGDSRWTKSEGVAFATDGRTTVLDETGIYHVDARGMTTQTLGGSGATQTGAGAWGGVDFLSRYYLGDPANNRVARVTPISTLQTFVTGINGAEGLAFGPGGTWGTDLYVADANLTSLGTSADGQGRIVRVTAAGAITNVVVNPSLLNGGSGMVFDTHGTFDGHLYVADILGERIIQVTQAGVATVFASGFKNLSGSQCLAFGEDGALYAADAGSGQSFSNVGSNEPPKIVRIAPAVLTTDAPGSVVSIGIELAPPVPNPARGHVRLRIAVPRGSPANLAIHDLAGRVVRTFAGDGLAGSREVVWSCRDDRGHRLKPGMYFAVLGVGDRRATRRIVLLP